MNRDKLYGLFGMESAWRRFETRDAPAGTRGDFERRMRAIESGADRLNLAPAMVHLAAEIAAFEPTLDHEDRLALILLVTMSLAALQDGSTRLAVGKGAGRRVIAPMLQVLCGDVFGAGGADGAAARIERMLAENRASHVIASDPQSYAPLIHIGSFLCHHRILLAESSLARALRERLWSKRSLQAREVKDAIADIVNRPVTVSGRSLDLSDEQREAVMRAVVSRFTLITGGPGTGKTSIVVAILRMLARLGVGPERIAVAAPTGKAAFRISENVTESLAQISDSSGSDKTLRQGSREAVTIHRLLGYRPGSGSFLYHANNPLSASVVIVDECSMLDLVLAERLLRAMPDDAQLVMLGDADQLPSVTAGAVFRDLVEVAENSNHASFAPACVRLTHSYRMDEAHEGGRTIARVAAAINQNDSATLTTGDSKSSPIALRTGPKDLAFEGVEMLTDVSAARIGSFLVRWHERFVRGDEIDELASRVYPRTENGFDEASSQSLKRLLDSRAASRILCLTRVLPTGTERVNRLMHQLSLEAARNSGEAGRFIVGEPVMVVRNDYERRLFNGDHGVVVKVGAPGGREVMMAAFNRRGMMVAFQLDALRESLELSYATTVHKAQGSEFESVALILPETQLPILSREILYTAVTRSRNSVVIVGDVKMLGESAARRIERHSGLPDLLLNGSG